MTFGSLRNVALSAAGLLILFGCGGDDDGPTATPMVPTTNPGTVATPESIPAYHDALHSPTLASQLNVYRGEAFGSGGYDLEASDILYTAAVRHAGYLDSTNSRDGSGGGDTGDDTGGIEITDSIEELYNETASDLQNINAPVYGSLDGASFPVFYTHNSLRNRVLAIGGGPAFLQQNVGTREVYECYILRTGDYIWDFENDQLSDFRGLAAYTPADHLWTHPYWHIPLMRASVRYLGYGPVLQARAYTGVVPPYPLFPLNDCFDGVVTLAEDTYPSRVVVESLWPADGSSNVPGWGFNGVGDITDATTNGLYSGPVMHYIVDTSYPIINVSVNFDITAGGGGNVALNTAGAGIADGNDVPVNIYLAYDTATVTDATDGSFAIDNTADLFSASTGGTGGTTQVEVTLMSNVQILEIDHPREDTYTGQGEINDQLVDTIYPPQFPNQVHIKFESALDDDVQVGDTVEMLPYSEPILSKNNSNDTDIYSDHDGQGTIVFINAGRDQVVLDFGDNLGDAVGWDEVATGTVYNALADGPNDTNAICDITGLRDDVGAGNGAAQLRNGELLAIPSCPLISGATYTFAVTMVDAMGNSFSDSTSFTVR